MSKKKLHTVRNLSWIVFVVTGLISLIFGEVQMSYSIHDRLYLYNVVALHTFGSLLVIFGYTRAWKPDQRIEAIFSSALLAIVFYFLAGGVNQVFEHGSLEFHIENIFAIISMCFFTTIPVLFFAERKLWTTSTGIVNAWFSCAVISMYVFTFFAPNWFGHGPINAYVSATTWLFRARIWIIVIPILALIWQWRFNLKVSRKRWSKEHNCPYHMKLML